VQSKAELRRRFEQECGEGFFLDLSDLAALDHHLRELGWIEEDHVESVEPAGEGDMNLTVRVRTARRAFIVKQSRPWVEKHPHIPAPARRAAVEAAFYIATATFPAVSGRMPALLGSDDRSQLLLLEDLGDSQNMMTLYHGDQLTACECSELIGYLSALHAIEVEQPSRGVFRNREMRDLNHAHQYEIPLRGNNGLDLDRLTPGLGDLAAELKFDRAYRFAVADVGRLYLLDGGQLVHGDFFPGSWLRHSRGLYVIDPEFCFLGCPEYDLGILYAHLVFAKQENLWNTMRKRYARDCDWKLAGRFAGAELMHRLIGVAQLPLHAGLQQKRAWLELSRMLLCA
jgi:5-methylthioribose kinase